MKKAREGLGRPEKDKLEFGKVIRGWRSTEDAEKNGRMLEE